MYKVDQLCVQETRWKGSKAISLGAGLKLFYHGVDGKTDGVGVLLKGQLAPNHYAYLSTCIDPK